MVETLLWLLLPAVICGALAWWWVRSSRSGVRARRSGAASAGRRAGSPPSPTGSPPSPAAPSAAAPSGPTDASAPTTVPFTPWPPDPHAPSAALPRRPHPAPATDGAAGAAPVWASATRLPTTAAPAWTARSTWASMTRRPRTPPPPDPFETLTVQVRLGVLAAQVRALDADAHAYGRGRRLFATQAAYDQLLAEACRMAGVEVAENPEPGQMRSEPERFREEMELAARGWSW